MTVIRFDKWRNGIARVKEIGNSFSNCISGTNIENGHFQKSHFSHWSGMMKMYFPKNKYFRLCDRNGKVEMKWKGN